MHKGASKAIAVAFIMVAAAVASLAPTAQANHVSCGAPTVSHDAGNAIWTPRNDVTWSWHADACFTFIEFVVETSWAGTFRTTEGELSTLLENAPSPYSVRVQTHYSNSYVIAYYHDHWHYREDCGYQWVGDPPAYEWVCTYEWVVTQHLHEELRTDYLYTHWSPFSVVRVDSVPPTVTLDFDGPHVTGDTLFATSATGLSATATDQHSGVGHVQLTTPERSWSKGNGQTAESVTVGPVTLTGPDGPYAVAYHAWDRALHKVYKDATVWLDNTPPVTSVAFAGPAVQRAGAPAFVSSATRLALGVDDGVGGSGAGDSTFAFNAEPAAPFESPFTVPATFADGAHEVTHHSTDRLGNTEAATTTPFVLDNTGPTTAVAFGAPSVAHPNGVRFVTSATPVTVRTDDGAGVGVAAASFRFNDEAVSAYQAPFMIPASRPDGAVDVTGQATDLLANTGAATTAPVVLDNSPPTTQAAVAGPHFDAADGTLFVTSSSTFTLPSDDGVLGVGVADSFYRIDDGAEQQFTGAFSLPTSLADGFHSITYWSVDVLGNRENARSVTPFLDNTNPEHAVRHPTPWSASYDDAAVQPCDADVLTVGSERPVTDSRAAATALAGAAATEGDAATAPARDAAAEAAPVDPHAVDVPSQPDTPDVTPYLPRPNYFIEAGPDACAGHVLSTIARAPRFPVPGLAPTVGGWRRAAGETATGALPPGTLDPAGPATPVVAAADETAAPATESAYAAQDAAGLPVVEVPIPGVSAHATPRVLVTGAVHVRVNATDGGGSGVGSVVFVVDGVVRAVDHDAPFVWTWDTTAEAAGEHELVVRSFDRLGHEAPPVRVVANTVPLSEAGGTASVGATQEAAATAAHEAGTSVPPAGPPPT